MPKLLKDFATPDVVSVVPETLASVAAQLMRKNHIGALVVVHSRESGYPVGVLTDRDLVLALMAEGLDPELFTVGDVMSVEPILASPEMDAMDAVELMRAHRLRRLILVDDRRQLAGIVSMEDVLEVLTRELSNLAVAVIGSRDREFEQRK